MDTRKRGYIRSGGKTGITIYRLSDLEQVTLQSKSSNRGYLKKMKNKHAEAGETLSSDFNRVSVKTF